MYIKKSAERDLSPNMTQMFKCLLVPKLIQTNHSKQIAQIVNVTNRAENNPSIFAHCIIPINT